MFWSGNDVLPTNRYKTINMLAKIFGFFESRENDFFSHFASEVQRRKSSRDPKKIKISANMFYLSFCFLLYFSISNLVIYGAWLCFFCWQAAEKKNYRHGNWKKPGKMSMLMFWIKKNFANISSIFCHTIIFWIIFIFF